MSTQQFQGPVEMLDTLHMKGMINNENDLNRIGTKRIQSFVLTGANLGATPGLVDGDVIHQLGTLDVGDSVHSGQAATRILIEKVTVNVTTAAGQTLTMSVHTSSDNGTAASADLANNTEIVGAAVTYIPGDKGSPGTEADVNLNSADLSLHGPNVDVAIAAKYLYAVGNETMNADATALRGMVVIEYLVC